MLLKVLLLCLVAAGASSEAQDTSGVQAVLSPVVVTARKGEADSLPVSFASTELSALRDIAGLPGLFLRDYGNLVGFSLRGATMEETGVTLEGFQVRLPQSGYLDLTTLPLPLIAGVAALRSGGSAYFGSGAMGGIVQLFLPPPSPAFRLVGGSFGYRSLMVTGGSGFPSALWGGGLALEKARNDYPAPRPRQNADFRRGGAYFKGFFPGGRFLLLFAASEEGVPPPAGQIAHGERIGSGLALAGLELGPWHLAFSGQTLRYVREGEEVDRHREGGFQLRWSPAPLRLGPLSGGPETEVDLDLVRSTRIGRRFRLLLSPAFRFGGAWGPFRLLGAFRVDVWPSHGTMAPSAFLGLGLPHGFFLNASRDFRLPTLNELYWPEDPYAAGNPSLKPEQAWSGELGWKGRAEAVFFLRHYSSLIRWIPRSGQWQPQNLSDVTLFGGETRLEGSLAPGVTLRASLTLLGYRSPVWLVYQPWAQGALSLAYRGWKLSWIWIGPRPERPSGPKRLPSIHWVDLEGEWGTPWQALRLTVRLQNLLNQTTPLIRGYPLPGRSFRFGLILSQEVSP